MIIDSSLEFASKQAVTASAASTKIVDTGTARNLGVGKQQLFLVVMVAAAMVGAGVTITPSLRSSASAASGALTGSPATVITGSAFPAASAAGTVQILPLPPSANYAEFLDVYFTATGGSLTGGQFNAFIVDTVDLQHFYPAGYTIQ